MPAKGSRISAGKRHIRTVSKMLPDGMAWDEDDVVALQILEDAEDRRAALAELLAAELARPQVSTRRVTETAAETRQVEVLIMK